MTIGDLSELPEAAVLGSLGPTQGRHLLDLARGIDHRPGGAGCRGEIDIGRGDLRPRPRRARRSWRRRYLPMPRDWRTVSIDRVWPRTVTLKLRFADFTTVTRSVTSGTAMDGPRDLYLTALDLLGHVEIDRPVRLLGLGASGLEPAGEPRQMPIGAEDNWSRVDEAVAGVRERFGERSWSRPVSRKT